MARQNLKARQAAIALQQFRGRKPTIRDCRDALKAAGLIDADPAQIVDEWELERARSLIQQVRKFDCDDEGGKAEMIALSEVLPDGTRFEYQRFVVDCTVDEAVKHLEYWNRQGRRCDRNLMHFFREFSSLHGRRKLEQRLTFELDRKSVV